jgi:putative peptide zinc metalloprotease protein
MNLSRALEVALPEIPGRTLIERTPRPDPGMVYQEHVEDGDLVVRVYVPCAGGMYTFPAEQWKMIQLFDGVRSYGEIAELYSGRAGAAYSAQDVRAIAEELEAAEFWYKTPLEKNVQLLRKSAEERRKQAKGKSKYGDLSEILFPALHPDAFLTWLHKYTSFIYTWWFTLLTLFVFGLVGGITIAHWSEIGRDTLQFYNFTHKTWSDIVLYYVLAIVTAAVHEGAHGHACKHCGGRVPTMGFALVYLLPAFYTDTTEGDVKGTRTDRFIISMAGVWSELMLYSIVTPIWWATPPDTVVHDAAYVIMLVSGLATVFLNWNPLMKLDGYYMLSEILGYADLKEASTAYVSGWVKKHIWGLPVEVPYVPRRRRLGFAVYAILSGAYSYTVLYVLARFAGNVFRNFNPDWSFIPEFATAGIIFRSRIRTLVNFMKFVYLDKKDRVVAWVKSRRAWMTIGAVSIFLVLPIWRESARGRFVLEPAERAVLRNVVPGVITNVYAQEGEHVVAGEVLFRMRNLPLQSKAARSQEEYAVASGTATLAARRYADFGPAMAVRDELARQSGAVSEEAGNLELKTPISGTVVTPRLTDRLGANAAPGTLLAEVDSTEQMRARIYVHEFDLYKFGPGARAAIQLAGQWQTRSARITAIAPVSSDMEGGLSDHTEFKGLRPTTFFAVDLLVDNVDGRLKPSMTGTARVYGKRRSIAGFVLTYFSHIFARKVW